MRILSNDFTGDIGSWVLPSNMTTLLIRNNDLSGDIGSWVLPATIVNFQIYGNDLSGDISSWVLTDAATPNLRFFQIHNNSLTGDLSAPGWANMTAAMDSLIISGNDLS